MSKYKSGISNRATLFYSHGPIKQSSIKIENNRPSKEYQKEIRNREIINDIPWEYEHCKFGEIDVN